MTTTGSVLLLLFGYCTHTHICSLSLSPFLSARSLSSCPTGVCEDCTIDILSNLCAPVVCCLLLSKISPELEIKCKIGLTKKLENV